MEWLIRFLVPVGDAYSPDSLNPDCAIAAFWKNGSRTELLNQSNPTVSSIVVSGSNLYACRTLWNNNNSMYWKNGLAVPLTGGTTRAPANQIAVSECDLYVGGAD